ncbi:glycosyltransferase [Alkalispirochaeta americana]|uniref:glycosyltransferase n=1 Tax=Alkalispirochaeta americana TaxID=159291 RepID=UPI0013564F0E|nr:glycosyltransferase [Alkalispirochaeta americana]
MDRAPLLSLVIPSLNGSVRLARLVPRVRSVLAEAGGGEVIIVDDGSDPVHREALAGMAGPGVRLVLMPRRTGQIGATLAGVAAARGELVVTLDDDGAHPPEVIPLLRRRLEEVPGCSLVYGVPRRKARGVRGLGTRLNSLLFHLFLGLPWSIPVGSFRMFRRELLVRALERPVAFPYLSAMLLQFRPVTAAVRYGEWPRGEESGRTAPGGNHEGGRTAPGGNHEEGGRAAPAGGAAPGGNHEGGRAAPARGAAPASRAAPSGNHEEGGRTAPAGGAASGGNHEGGRTAPGGNHEGGGRAAPAGRTAPGGNHEGGRTAPGGNHEGGRTAPGGNHEGGRAAPGGNHEEGGHAAPGGNHEGGRTAPGGNHEGGRTAPSGNHEEGGRAAPAGGAAPGGNHEEGGRAAPGGNHEGGRAAPARGAAPGGNHEGGRTAPGGNHEGGGHAAPGGNHEEGGRTAPGGNHEGGRTAPGGNHEAGRTAPSGNHEGGRTAPSGNHEEGGRAAPSGNHEGGGRAAPARGAAPGGSSYTLARLLKVYGLLLFYWGPLRALGRVARRPRRALPRPRLMVLGGGSSQLGILERARREGFLVVLADQAENPPGRVLADRYVQASTFDHRAVSRAARELGVDAIVAAGSDQPVYTAARASQDRGLPYPLSPREALLVTNKAHMKERFRHAGIPTVPWAVLGDDPSRWDQEGLAQLRLPWVVKPLDSQGQRGIAIVHNRRELLDHRPRALSFSRETSLLVEEYYPSREVTLSGWASRKGAQPEIWAVTDRITFPPDLSGGQGLGVCLAHRYPSCFARGRTGEIRDITESITRAFGLGGVPLYFQFLLGAEGVRVNEIACRLGGAYEDISLPPVTGVDVLGRQLGWFQTALGLPRREESLPRQGSFCAVPLIFARPGRVAACCGREELLELPGVEACQFLLPPGTVIAPRSNSTQRIAFAVLRGSSRQEVNNLVDRLFDTLRAENARGENLLIDTRGDIKVRSGL